MSRARAVETLKRLFVALNAGQPDAVQSCLTGDIVFDTFGGVREIGRERVRWAIAERGRFFREVMRDLVLMSEDSGRRAAAEFTLRGVYQAEAPGLPAASGQAYSVPAGAFFDIEDNGLVARASFMLNGVELARQLAR